MVGVAYGNQNGLERAAKDLYECKFERIEIRMFVHANFYKQVHLLM